MQGGVELRARYLVLLLLAEGPKTGYELMKRVRELFSQVHNAPSLSPGTLYPLLHSMEREGLVVSVEEPRGQRMRKVYRLTEKGLLHLFRMLLHGIELLEEGFKLHIAALRSLVEEPDRAGIVAELAEEMEQRLEAVEKLIESMRSMLRALAGAGHSGQH